MKLDNFGIALETRLDNILLLDNKGKILSEVFGDDKYIKQLENMDDITAQENEILYRITPLLFSISKNNIKNIDLTIKDLQSKFKEKFDKICSILDTNYFNRIGCRFKSSYSGCDNNFLNTILGNEVTEEQTYIDKTVRKKGINLYIRYERSLLTVDVDKYFNGEKFKVDDIQKKLDYINSFLIDFNIEYPKIINII